MRVIAGIVLSAALVTGLAACGDGDDKKQDEGQVATEFGTAKPEDVRASANEVADGFGLLNQYANEVLDKLGVDDAGAAETQERLLTIWESILGTVKANDEAAYQRIDAALTVLMDAKGSAGKAQAQGAADTVRTTGADYVKRYPGTASASPGSTSPHSTAPSDSGADVPTDSGGGTGY
jgi:hypothetical protein